MPAIDWSNVTRDSRYLIDDMINEREKNKLLSEEMEATLHDIQNM